MRMFSVRARRLTSRVLRIAAGASRRKAQRPSLRLELVKEYRGRALLYLALSRVRDLRLNDRDTYSLQFDVDLADYWKLLSTSASARPDPDVVIDTKAGSGWSVSYDYFERELNAGEFAAPYTLHPYYYASGAYRTLPAMRHRHQRNIGLFFAGSTGIQSYETDFKFPLMNRLKVMDWFLQTHRDRIFYIRDETDYRKALESDLPFVASLTDKDGDNLQKHRLNPTQYMDLLSRSRFALCPPGVRMPQSHNLIEAVSVGAVPILEYASWCRPALTHGVNCLTFDTLNSLSSVIDTALGLSTAQAAELSAGAARYYDEACSVDGFGNRLADALKRQEHLQLVVLDESASVEAWLATRHAGQTEGRAK